MIVSSDKKNCLLIKKLSCSHLLFNFRNECRGPCRCSCWNCQWGESVSHQRGNVEIIISKTFFKNCFSSKYSSSPQITAKILLYLLQGYQGMVDGGDNICEATWQSVSGIMQMVCNYFLCAFSFIKNNL